MYNVYLDQQLIHDLDSDDNVLVSPTLNLELNKAGTFEFTMEPTHPFYDKLERFSSIIQVLQDGEEIFKGRIIEVSDDMYKQRSVYCESELAYLNDTIQRPHEFHLAANAVVEYLNAVIGSHNEQVDESRQFELGEITIKDPNDYIYCYTNYNPTMDELKEDLVDDLGGYIRVRNVYENNDPLGKLQHRYLDYIGLEEYGKTSEQYIEFGENLLDFVSDIDQSDLCTGIIPLGATLEESEYSAIEERVTIESVNSGSDYIYIPEAVNKYGLILKVVTWDDITLPENLLSTAENYLSTYDYENMVITATAVDLSILGATGSVTQTLSTREVLSAYDTVTYTLTASNPITEIVSYTVYDRDDTGYARITRISFSGNTVSVTVDNSSRTDDLDITVTVVVRTDVSVEAWRLGDMIYVESTPHDVHKRFPLAQMSIPLDQPESTSVTLGTYEDTSLSAKTNKTESGLRNFEDFSTGNIIASAVAQATAIIDMKTNGYVTLHMDEDRGCVDELLIMDTPSTDTATRVWRWNLNGLGYSGSGYDTEHGASYETAITMDGHILGTLIIANGMILADDKDVEFAKFTDEGMKIYAQSGRDDLILMTIGRTGMDIYDDTGKAILGSFNSSGVQIYSTSYLLMGLYADGMKLYNADGSTLMRLFSGGLRVYNTSGIVRSSLDPDSLDIYDDDGNVLMTMTNSGAHYYYGGTLLGNIGTGYLTGYPDSRGLGFHLENSAAYMSFGWKATSSATEYTVEIAYHSSNSPEAQGVHIGDTLYLRSNKLYFSSKETDGYVVSESNGGAIFYGAKWYFQNCELWYGENSTNCYKVLTTNSMANVTIKNGSSSESLEYYIAGTWTLDISNLFSNYALASQIPTVPSNVSAFTNDAGYVTSNDLSGYIKSGDTLGVTFRGDAGSVTINTSYSNSLNFDLRGIFSGGSSFEAATLTLNVDEARYPASGTIESGKTCEINLTDMLLDAAVGYANHTECLSTSSSIDMGGGSIYADWHNDYIFFGLDDRELYLYGTTIKIGELATQINIGGSGNNTDIRFTGYRIVFNSSVIHSSDERLKTDIQLLSKPMLDDISPVSFKWKEGDERTHFGYIAQDVKKKTPELVYNDDEGMLGIAYTEIIPLLHLEIMALKQRIAQLEGRA